MIVSSLTTAAMNLKCISVSIHRRGYRSMHIIFVCYMYTICLESHMTMQYILLEVCIMKPFIPIAGYEQHYTHIWLRPTSIQCITKHILVIILVSIINHFLFHYTGWDTKRKRNELNVVDRFYISDVQSLCLLSYPINFIFRKPP